MILFGECEHAFFYTVQNLVYSRFARYAFWFLSRDYSSAD